MANRSFEILPMRNVCIQPNTLPTELQHLRIRSVAMGPRGAFADRARTTEWSELTASGKFVE